MMTIAIPIWNDQVSTTFDFSEKLLIVETESGCEISRKEVRLKSESIAARVADIKNNGGQVLLCGAVSRPLAMAVLRAGIQVIPFVTGDVDSVLAAYLCGKLTEPCFLQPGCRPGARRRWRHGNGRGNCRLNQ
jgi:predicted Fe-Mo cluster-binding NifX family protein